MQIIGYHLDRDSKTIFTSTGEKCSEPPYIEFLLKETDAIRVCYHLDFMVSNIFCLIKLTKPQLMKLYDTTELTIGSYKFKYVPKKFLSIIKDEKFVLFSDASQYMERWDLLGDPTEKAVEARKIAVQVYNTLAKLGLHPKSIISPIATFEKEVLVKMDLPTIDDMPIEAAQYAYECCTGPIIQSYKIGRFDRCWDYDIKCYSEDTEVLSISGWKLIKDLYMGELILTFNPTNSKCYFQSVLQLHKSFYDGEMVHIKTHNHIDLLLTPNHTVLFKDRIRSKNSKIYKTLGKLGKVNDWRKVEASSLPNGNIDMPVSYPTADKEDYPIEDNKLKILAWIITEGFRCQRTTNTGNLGDGISITQSLKVNPSNCVEIRNCFTNLNIHYTERIRSDGHKCLDFHISPNLVRQHFNHLLDQTNLHIIPLWILQNCSKRQLNIFFQTLIKGDGTERRSLGVCISNVFFTDLRINADRMSYLCHLLGYKSFIYTRQHTTPLSRRDLKYRYHVNINLTNNHPERKKGNKNDTTITYGKVGKAIYKGYVYCPTVANAFIIVRRNDKSCICGNSAYASILMNCIDYRHGEWKKIDHFDPTSHYGYYKGTVNMTADFHPIVYARTNEQSTTPKGEWERKSLKEELEFITKYERGTWEVEDGWVFYPTKLVYPYKKVILWLNDWKDKTKGMERKVVKRVLESLWGYTLRVDWDGETATPSEYMNTVFGAQTETLVKLKDAQFVIENGLEDNLLNISVDGVLVDKEVKLIKKKESDGN